MQPGRYPRILPAAPAGYAGPPSAPGNPIEASKEQSKKRLSSQPRPERLVNGQRAIELVELLKSLPEDRSTSLFKRLREKGDPAAVISESRGPASEGASPSKSDYYTEYKQHQSSMEGELIANNPRSFPVLPPIDPAVLARSNLLRPWLPEPAWGQLSENLVQKRMSHTNLHFISYSNEAEPHLTIPPEYPDPQEQPVEYCDERLQYLQVGFWTDIKVSNDFVAKVISVYMINHSSDYSTQISSLLTWSSSGKSTVPGFSFMP
ncbi:hypothetical protein NPX13_g10720 [Xylaria arbuscula]|uniref:Uncharacterized protein n=1 Tax=Xylaria arbuscula TaxID=114810 RepID=A0A9W8N413_9PEZI|nr:hypothetical protein NPX13_g10720 [Xylaria arbuscula]